jgi:hypothetical protein
LKLKDSDYTLKLIIENKVDSTETENEKGISQTQKYYDHFEKPKPTRKNSKKYIKNNEINLYVYLTAIPSIVLNQLREPLSGCKDFIQINYQDLLDNLFEPILDMDNILERTRFMVGEYIQSLSHHAIKGEVKDEKRKSTVKQALIMALGKEERELLSSFWREHEKLILTALYALSTHGSKDEKISDTRHKLQAVSSPNSKDRSKYSLKYEGELFKKDFLKCDIGLNTVKLLISKGLIDNDVFNFLREDRTCKLQLIKDKEEITPNERQKNKYKSIETPEFYFNGKKYFVASNWAAETANIFIEKIEKKFKNITFLK